MWSRSDSIPRHAATNFNWIAKLESYHGAKTALSRLQAKLSYIKHLFARNHTHLERVKVEDALM